MENLVTELDYLKAIYELLYKLIPLSNLITGLLQCFIVVVVLVVLYKLFNLFFNLLKEQKGVTYVRRNNKCYI